jgi:hypothetical protein
MSESNYNWVCFDCRYTTRKPKTSERTPKCLHCGDECYCLGYKVEIPKKEDKKSWERLRQNCRERLFETTELESKYKVHRKHEIEKEIIRLESLGDSKERRREVNNLKKELNNYT